LAKPLQNLTIHTSIVPGREPCAVVMRNPDEK
jgi:hypothetical protein